MGGGQLDYSVRTKAFNQDEDHPQRFRRGHVLEGDCDLNEKKNEQINFHHV